MAATDFPHAQSGRVTGHEPGPVGGRIVELDGLRGVAILMVLTFHYIATTSGGEFGSFLYRFKQAFRLGWSGVDLFFVLSGFLIGGILLRARDAENYYQTFYTRRIYRIFPIYYLWIFLYLIIRFIGSSWIPGLIPVAATGYRHTPVYILFLQNFVFMPFGTFDWYWFLVTWSLAVEEQFYLVAPFLIRNLSKAGLTRALWATVFLAPVLREIVYRFTPASYAYWYNLMPCRADALAIGVLAALAWESNETRTLLVSRKKVLYGALICLACGVPLLLKYYPSPSSHLTAIGGFSWLAFLYVTLLLVIVVDPDGIVGRFMRLKWLTGLGTVSYCLYLIHFPINGALHAALLRERPSISTLPGAAVTMLATLVSIVLAALSWKYLEGPIVRRGHRFSYRAAPRRIVETHVAVAGIESESA